MDELNRKSVSAFKSADKAPIAVVLDNVRSMHNVGSVFRTADAFLIEGIALCGYTPQPPHRDIQKTALGATETVAWKYYASTMEAVQFYKEQGYNIWAIEQVDNSISLDSITTEILFNTSDTKKIAVVFGNEVSGVDDVILPLCNGSIEIPQSGMKHSLNISVAAGIVLWELAKKVRSYLQ